jgi:hypothetical protein
MTKKEKGNGGDPPENIENQMKFLAEVKALAQKHGIQMAEPMGGGISDAMQAQRSLRIQVREQNGQVVVDFGRTPEGKPNSISWMALSVEQATKFAATMIKMVQNIQSIGAVGGAAEAPADKPAEDATEKKTEKTEKVDKPK